LALNRAKGSAVFCEDGRNISIFIPGVQEGAGFNEILKSGVRDESAKVRSQVFLA
jgi:hypothetical protein